MDPSSKQMDAKDQIYTQKVVHIEIVRHQAEEQVQKLDRQFPKS